MAQTVSEMTPVELKEMIEVVVETTVERKMLELLGDPDERLVLRKKVRDRLLRQQQAVAGGERGRDLESVVGR